MKYRVVIGGVQTDLEILPGPDPMFTVEMDGKTYLAEVQHVDGAEIFTLLVNGQSWEFIAQRDGTNYTITLQGEPYRARLFEGALARMDQLPIPAHDVTEATLTATMPGVVIDVLVSAGDAVAQGTTLVVIESMKMNNPIKSPRDGHVKSISVTKGQRVNRGDVLAVID